MAGEASCGTGYLYRLERLTAGQACPFEPPFSPYCSRPWEAGTELAAFDRQGHFLRVLWARVSYFGRGLTPAVFRNTAFWLLAAGGPAGTQPQKCGNETLSTVVFWRLGVTGGGRRRRRHAAAAGGDALARCHLLHPAASALGTSPDRPLHGCTAGARDACGTGCLPVRLPGRVFQSGEVGDEYERTECAREGGKLQTDGIN